MASFRGHITFSTITGVALGALSWWKLGVPGPVATVAGGLCALGGILPDLDSDSGVPQREIFGVAAALVPILMVRRFAELQLTPEETLLLMAGIFFTIRYIAVFLFQKLTVHRGMLHSVPAMLITGFIVFHAYQHPSKEVRGFMAIATMIGFLSHLVLDEIYAVDFSGMVPKLNQFAGSAVKLHSKSWKANIVSYLMASGLGFTSYSDFMSRPAEVLAVAQRKAIEFKEHAADRPAFQFQWPFETKSPFEKKPELPLKKPELPSTPLPGPARQSPLLNLPGRTP